jgi:B-block binding subunit of TFIIIC
VILLRQMPSAGQGDDDAESILLDTIARAGRQGLTRTGMHELLKNHADAADIASLIQRLEQRGLVVTTIEASRGRPRIVTRLAVWSGPD